MTKFELVLMSSQTDDRDKSPPVDLGLLLICRLRAPDQTVNRPSVMVIKGKGSYPNAAGILALSSIRGAQPRHPGSYAVHATTLLWYSNAAYTL